MRKTVVSLLMALIFLVHNAAMCADAPVPPTGKTNDTIFPVEELFEEARKPGDDKFFVEFIKMLATLGLVIGLILIVAWFLKRLVNSKLEQANLTSAIKVLERRTLSPKTSIYLIEIHDKTIALAESAEGRVARLAEFPFALSATDSDDETSPSFKKLLDGNKPDQ